MQLPIQSQSTIYVQDWETKAGVDELVAVTQAADRLDFDYVGVCDHVAIPRERAAAMGTTWYDPISTLGFLAGVTQRVRLLSHVLVAVYRHPLVIAKQFSTLDTLSKGRAVLGVGAGHVEGEFDALGVPFSERGKRTTEIVKDLRRLFADEFGWGEVGQRPRPVQPGGVPIWIGGSSPAALRRAATLGDGWLPQGPPEGGMAAGIATINRLREEAGRASEPYVIGSLGSYHVGDFGGELKPHVVSGSAQRVAEAVRQQLDLGVTHLQVGFPSRSCNDLIDQMAAFMTDVVPLATK
jgi:probable F420-dependent oxidoreductase